MASSEELHDDVLFSLQRERDRLRTESELLRGLIDELKQTEHDAQQRAHLLNTIVNLLPVAVTVTAQDGHFMLVNDAAAAQFGVTAENLAVSLFEEVVPEDEASTERDQELGLISVGKSVSEEENVAGPAGECTLLTSRK